MLRLACVLFFASFLSACSIDKTPEAPVHKQEPVDNPAPPAPEAPAAPAPAPAVIAEVPPANDEMQTAQARTQPIADTFAEIEKMPEIKRDWEPALKLRAMMKNKSDEPAHSLESGNRDLNQRQRMLLRLARDSQTQSDQDLYMFLVDNDLLLYAKDGNGASIFHWLACEDRLDVAQALLKAKFNHGIREFDYLHRQPLHYARSGAFTDLLIRAGNDVGAPDTQGRTPLMAMISRDESDAIPPLTREMCAKGRGVLALFNGVPINALDKSGKTALQQAQARGNATAIENILICPEGRAKAIARISSR